MYCSHCGTENENTAKFCRQCGNALQANAQSNSVPSAFEQEISASKGRQSVANFLRAFQAHVAPQAKNYSVLNAQCSQMEMLERQRADFEKGVKSPVLLILGIVLIALGIGLIASFVSYMQAHIDEAVIIENPTLADYLDTFVALLFLAGPLIIGGIIIAIFIVRKARAENSRENREPIRSGQIDGPDGSQRNLAQLRVVRKPPTRSVQVRQPLVARRSSPHRSRRQGRYAHPGNSVFRERMLPARNEGHRKRKLLRNARGS
ncbi:MAG: zinc ribbon domain-containing protein [Slackia isoflavoniconvertens]|nr:zinc ribbon domain-containing protein [Slackia isoflavoniconvertens]